MKETVTSNRLTKAIEYFRSDPENERLFQEAQKEIRSEMDSTVATDDTFEEPNNALQ